MKCLIGKGKADTSYGNWSKDPKHRRQAQIRGVFRGTWPENGGPLPWRLTREEIRLLETRMSNVLWPHYMERLYYRGASCWTRPNRMWKARRKFRLMWYILVPQLRGLVPAVHNALNLFVWAVRRLEGQVRVSHTNQNPSTHSHYATMSHAGTQFRDGRVSVNPARIPSGAS
jgi:hypothetical protein